MTYPMALRALTLSLINVLGIDGSTLICEVDT